MDKIAVLIPCYNESATIAKVVQDYRAALLFLCPVLTEYLHTGLVPRLPTFVAACFMALFSLQSFICGLILDTQGKMHRQNFELQMTILSGMYHAAQTTDNEKAK